MWVPTAAIQEVTQKIKHFVTLPGVKETTGELSIVLFTVVVSVSVMVSIFLFSFPLEDLF